MTGSDPPTPPPMGARHSDHVRRRVVVSGRVQGVGYRYHCRRAASRLGLDGWVRNHRDGTVELLVEGDPDDVDELIAWCRNGPRHAIVTDVVVTDVVVTDVVVTDLTVTDEAVGMTATSVVDGAFRIIE